MKACPKPLTPSNTLTDMLIHYIESINHHLEKVDISVN